MHRLKYRHERTCGATTVADSSIDRHGRGKHTREKHLSVILYVNDRFQAAFDNRKYRLTAKFSWFDDEVAQCVSKWVKRLQVQTNSQVFDSLEPFQ